MADLLVVNGNPLENLRLLAGAAADPAADTPRLFARGSSRAGLFARGLRCPRLYSPAEAPEGAP